MTTSVDLVLRQYPALGSLEHSTRSISTFLGPPPSLSLSEACKLGQVPLLDWIWSSSCVNAADRTTGWSFANYLRSDPHYYRWQFLKSLYVAAERGDLEMVEWVVAHFSGCAPFKVVEAAAWGGHLHVLRFLWGHRSGNVRTEISSTTPENYEDQDDFQCNGACTVQFSDSTADNWGAHIIKKTVENGQLKECLASGMCLGRCDRRIAIKHALDIDQIEFAESLLPEGGTILDYADGCPGLDIIEKMIESGRVQWDEKYATSALSNVAKSGRVELMTQLLQLHSPLRGEHELWKEAWLNAFTEACSHDKLDVVEWLMGHSLYHEVSGKMKNGSGTGHAVLLAIQRGHVKVMQYLFEHGLFPNVHKLWDAQDAFRDSPLTSVKWLADHIWVDHPQLFGIATAEAVEFGRVDLLEFLQSLDPQGYEALGNRRRRTGPTFSWHTDLHYWAAKSGHVTVLKWLQENRPGESDYETMDIAASQGHLGAVKWLHANRSEGCSIDSTYLAAQEGHLEMVKWLFENRPESRTCAALLRAIRGSHLRVAYWLRKKYPEYLVTDDSVEPHKRLLGGGWQWSNALATLLFLREFCSPHAFFGPPETIIQTATASKRSPLISFWAGSTRIIPVRQKLQTDSVLLSRFPVHSHGGAARAAFTST